MHIVRIKQAKTNANINVQYFKIRFKLKASLFLNELSNKFYPITYLVFLQRPFFNPEQLGCYAASTLFFTCPSYCRAEHSSALTSQKLRRENYKILLPICSKLSNSNSRLKTFFHVIYYSILFIILSILFSNGEHFY